MAELDYINLRGLAPSVPSAYVDGYTIFEQVAYIGRKINEMIDEINAKFSKDEGKALIAKEVGVLIEQALADLEIDGVVTDVKTEFAVVKRGVDPAESCFTEEKPKTWDPSQDIYVRYVFLNGEEKLGSTKAENLATLVGQDRDADTLQGWGAKDFASKKDLAGYETIENADKKFATAAQGALAETALQRSEYTATDVFNKVKTKDGKGSGLDADTLQGWGAKDFARKKDLAGYETIENADKKFATKTQLSDVIAGLDPDEIDATELTRKGEAVRDIALQVQATGLEETPSAGEWSDKLTDVSKDQLVWLRLKYTMANNAEYFSNATCDYSKQIRTLLNVISTDAESLGGVPAEKYELKERTKSTVTGVVMQFGYSALEDSPPSSWSESIGTEGEESPYLWQRLKHTHLDGSNTYTTATRIPKPEELDTSQFATAAQGALAETALQRSDYTATDVFNKVKTKDGKGSGLDADMLQGWGASDFARKKDLAGYETIENADKKFATAAQGALAETALQRSDYTATDVFNKVKTKDGHGSELDADKLDGLHGTSYVKTAGTKQYLGTEPIVKGTGTYKSKMTIEDSNARELGEFSFTGTSNLNIIAKQGVMNLDTPNKSGGLRHNSYRVPTVSWGSTVPSNQPPGHIFIKI